MKKKLYILSRTSDTYRVWVKKDDLPEKKEIEDGQWKIKTARPVCLDKLILDQFSIWGGPDSIDDHYLSWEFSKTLDPRPMMEKLGFELAPLIILNT